jgi:hypothetical protein
MHAMARAGAGSRDTGRPILVIAKPRQDALKSAWMRAMDVGDLDRVQPFCQIVPFAGGGMNFATK